MIPSFIILLLCQLLGELLVRALHLPVPGPVLGMLVLAAWYGILQRQPARLLQHTADDLLRWLGLLFVPAGVGIFANLQVLRAAWLPVTVALVGSTLLTLLTTALLMQWLTWKRA